MVKVRPKSYISSTLENCRKLHKDKEHYSIYFSFLCLRGLWYFIGLFSLMILDVLRLKIIATNDLSILISNCVELLIGIIICYYVFLDLYVVYKLDKNKTSNVEIKLNRETRRKNKKNKTKN